MSAVSAGIAMKGVSDEELIERTTALVDGLEVIAKRYEEHVFLAWEDPVVLGVVISCCIRRTVG